MNKEFKTVLKRSLQRIDYILLGATVFLFIFGVIMILSASNVEAFVRYNTTPYHYFVKQIEILLFASVVTLPLIFIPTTKYKKLMYLVMAAIIFALVIVFPIGSVVNNANSWIPLGFFNFQPSELAKIVLIVFLAYFFEQNKNKLNDDWVMYIPLIIISILGVLVILQPDIGTAAIIGIIGLAIFSKIKFNKEKTKTLIIGFSLLAVLASAILLFAGDKLLTEEQSDRLNFARPCDKYTSEGYQVCNGYIAINNGGLLGVGIGDSTQKYLYIPEAYTDFIFAIVMEEMGFIKSLLFVFLPYLIILWRLIVISNSSHTIRGKLIPYGVAVYMLAHISINLLGLFGWAPYTGVPLPFLSYGGSFAISLIIALSLVQRINIENKLYKSKKH
jgi:cell division protein FtsW